MTHARIAFLPLLLALLFALCACGPSNTLQLRPVKPAASVLPAPTASTIAVVKLQDKRVDTTSLGLRRDRSYFTTMDDPMDWVSRAIADQLTSRGFQVSYTMNTSEAMRAKPDFILNGSVDKLEVTETSAASYKVQISINYVLANRDRIVLRQPFNINNEKTSFPGNNAVEGLLAEALKDLAVHVGDKVADIVKH